MTESFDENYRMKFNALERLYGQGCLTRLARAHVAVVGLGGVGSWTAEALARSGVQHLTLIDLDDICITNTNRQIHTIEPTIGQPKARALAERLRAIHSGFQIQAIEDYLTASTEAALLDQPYDYVIDAIDSLSNKVRLIRGCRQRQIPVLTVGGAGGRRDPSRITVDDLCRSTHDGLLRRVRKELRRREPELGQREAYDIPCVYSQEHPVYPSPDGGVSANPSQRAGTQLDCESGYGTAAFVTGAFGFAAASRVVADLCRSS
jgi:tRNA A37 threonylcarbamoyladenosine dehydratase